MPEEEWDRDGDGIANIYDRDPDKKATNYIQRIKQDKRYDVYNTTPQWQIDAEKKKFAEKIANEDAGRKRSKLIMDTINNGIKSMKAGLYQSAIDNFEQAIKLTGIRRLSTNKFREFHNMYGRAYLFNRNYREAIEGANKIISSIDKEYHVPQYITAGYACIGLGDYKTAIKNFKKAKGSAKGWFGMALSNHFLGKLKEAKKAIIKVNYKYSLTATALLIEIEENIHEKTFEYYLNYVKDVVIVKSPNTIKSNLIESQNTIKSNQIIRQELEDNLNTLSVQDLRQGATTYGIDLNGLTEKAEIIYRMLDTLKCPRCDRQFRVKKELTQHIKEKHPEHDISMKELKPFQCDSCNRRFKTEDGLEQHEKAKHPLKEIENDYEETSDDLHVEIKHGEGPKTTSNQIIKKELEEHFVSFRGAQIPQFEVDVLQRIEQRINEGIISSNLANNFAVPSKKFILLGEVGCRAEMGFSVENNRVTGIGIYCGYSGTLLVSIGNLSSLERLFLNNNLLSTLPESIGKLSSLKELDLSSNRFSTLPEVIGKLSSLKELDLNNNNFSTIPEVIGKLSSLKELDLSGNHLVKKSMINKSMIKQLKKNGVKIYR